MNRLKKDISFGLLGLAALTATVSAETPSRPKGRRVHTKTLHSGEVKIGMVQSMFRGVPDSTLQAMLQSFGTVMQGLTGVNGRVEPFSEAKTQATELQQGKIQLGVFNGYEYAWLHQTHPDFKPLMIAVSFERQPRAYIAVKADSTIGGIADLAGKNFALPRQVRDHCLFYLQERCLPADKDASRFFSKITSPATEEECLEDVVDGVVQGTIVDGGSIECFKKRKPGRWAKLKIVQRSESFPAIVVVYRDGGLDDATLQSFRSGMVHAGDNFMGKQLMTLWKLSGFEAIPDDYEETLISIAKAYPVPTWSKRN